MHGATGPPIHVGGHSGGGGAFGHSPFVVVYALGAESAVHGYNTGGTHQGATDQPTAVGLAGKLWSVSRNLPELESGNAQPRVGYEVHVVNHGQPNLANLLNRLQLQGNLFNLTGRPGLQGFFEVYEGILPWDAFDPQSTEMPSGATYANPTGITTLQQMYLQVGAKRRRRGRPVKNEKTRYNLDVRLIMTQYQETGDFETRIQIRVIVYPEWVRRPDGTAGYGYVVEEFRQHQDAAIKLATRLYNHLSAIEPQKGSKRLRRWQEKHNPAPYPIKVHQPGVYDESVDDMRQEDGQAGQLERDIDNQVTGDTADTTTMPLGDGPNTGAPPPTQVIIVGQEGDFGN